MSLSDQKSRSGPIGSRRFRTTHWSLVLAAGRRSAAQGRAALATLCQTYWYPLYAFVRRQGYAAPDAQDLTQGFFARLLEKNSLAAVSRQKGRFRSFLITTLKHFLSNERDRARAQKRGGGRTRLRLDFDAAENRYRGWPGRLGVRVAQRQEELVVDLPLAASRVARTAWRPGRAATRGTRG